MKKLITSLAILPLFFIIASPVSADYLERVSVGNPALPPEEEVENMFPAINFDGNYVAFQSESFLTIPHQTCEGIYVRNRLTNITEHINRDSDDNEICQIEDPFSISSDGRFVAFPVNRNSVYVRDRINQTLELISISDSGTPAVGQTGNPYISGDGRYIIFVSDDPTLDNTVTIPNTGKLLVYVRDRQNNTTRLVSIDQNNNLTGGVFIENRAPSISDDGRYVVWFGEGVFIKDLSTNVVTQLANATFEEHGKISRDGSTVAFSNFAALFVYKTATQTTQQLPITTNNLTRIDINDNGQYIVFITGNSTSFPQGGIIIYDTVQESATNIAPSNSLNSEELVLSGNGRYIAFQTYTQLLPEDQNEFQDIYLLDLTETPPPPSEPQTVTFNASADTYVRGGHDNQNEGAGQFMRIQSSGSNRALVRFDQGALQSAVGNGEILSATLRLTITDNGNNWGTSGRTVDLHRLIADWAEGNGTENDRGTGSGATWSCATDSLIENLVKNCSGSTEWEMGQPNNPAVHPWIETASATQTITNNQTGIVAYDVTADVTNFLNGTDNYGWIVKKTAEGQAGQVSFGTKESASIPQLIVTYQP